jgi:ribosomal protein L35AE/L33A
MAVVRRQEGDKTKVNAKGVLVITRANGNVVKINGQKGTIVRKKADGTVVKQKLTKPGGKELPPVRGKRVQNVRGKRVQKPRANVVKAQTLNTMKKTKRPGGR